MVWRSARWCPLYLAGGHASYWNEAVGESGNRGRAGCAEGAGAHCG